ncbi:PKD domain-containing protein [Hymenobacter sp. UV11]|uniref:PKD domain-containing protein n=1 Tax=Hymenobacter sp. UV11 TaxID=1849735 RepID=UPI001414DE15|nr:PKD domain-containing protein [Hymenobacter sp. UV11]
MLAQEGPLLHPDLHRTTTSAPSAAASQAMEVVAALPTNRVSHLSRELQQLYGYSKGVGAASRNTGPVALQEAFPRLLLSQQGAASVLVRITARDVAALRPQLEARGFVTVSARPQLHFIEGELPVSALATGAAGIESLTAQGLMGVRPVWRPITSTGRYQNQADYGLQANRVRAAKPTGYDGTGLRIGVMSDSYNSLGGAAAGVASGDLPATVQVLQDLPAGQGTDEGRAMIELIHDIAPGAGKAFSAIFRGEADFGDQVLRLADPTLGNCKVLVDDISYLGEPMFQDGVVAQAINDVSSRLGVTFFGSAGNQADASCEYVGNPFVPVAGGSGNADLNFNPTGTADTRQHFSIPKGAELFLVMQWSDPFYTTNGVKSDLDMYLIKTRPGGPLRGDTIAISNDDNIANQEPVEGIDYTNNNDTDTEFDLVISRYKGTADPARVKYISYRTAITDVATAAGIHLEYFTHSSTVTGHHAAQGINSVAAAPSYLRRAAESFTSKGNPTYLFNADGSPLAAPVVRAKPDFTSIDGSSTTFFGQKFAGQDPKDGFLFFGTSAAAPNAAAVAALLLQANPNFTPAQVNARLIATTLDINTLGFDALTGAGLINAYDAIFGPQTSAPAPFVETFDSQNLSRAWELQGNSYGRILVRSDYGPASTPGHLVLDGILAAAGVTNRPNFATLRLDLSAATPGGWVLTFKHKKFAGETDQAMPATFTTSSSTDGVALSVDGTNWFRLADITGTNATTSYKTVTVNLNDFATANSLTLGANVRIRFQSLNTGEVDTTIPAYSGGRAFDDVVVTGANVTQAPVAQFNASATAVALCPGSTVQFTDASLFAPTSYAWTFPGGTPATSTLPNPVVTYNTAGTYDATLTVTNASGSSTRTLTGVVTISSVKPTANFTARQAPICPGGRITFTNRSTNCPSTYAWTFPGGTPATSTDASPTVTFATAGTYTVSLVASNSNGASTAKTFTVLVQGAALAIPYAETFATGIPTTWGVLNPDGGLTWTTAANTLLKDGTRGTAVAMPFYSYAAAGQRDSLQSPAFNLAAGQPQATLRFDVAYAPVDLLGSANDSLAVFAYTACTNTQLGRVYLKSAAAGLPTTLPRSGTSYTPSSPTQWRQENVDLSAYVGQQVYLRFVAYNRRGNNLYLSNVRIDNNILLATRAQVDSPLLQAYPSPVAGGHGLTLSLPSVAGSASVRLIDALGRTTWQATVALSSGAATNRTLSAPLAAGLYTVLCETADGQRYTRRVVVE